MSFRVVRNYKNSPSCLEVQAHISRTQSVAGRSSENQEADRERERR